MLCNSRVAGEGLYEGAGLFHVQRTLQSHLQHLTSLLFPSLRLPPISVCPRHHTVLHSGRALGGRVQPIVPSQVRSVCQVDAHDAHLGRREHWSRSPSSIFLRQQASSLLKVRPSVDGPRGRTSDVGSVFRCKIGNLVSRFCLRPTLESS